MNTVTETMFPPRILFSSKTPCVSIYQQTHRHSPDNKQDKIRFKNSIKLIERSIKTKYSNRKVNQILDQLYLILEDQLFWSHMADGLAVLANEDEIAIYQLNRTVEELAIAADSFHTKPLLRHFQSMDRFYALGLSKNKFAIFEGDRYGFEEVWLGDEVPTTIEAFLGERDRKRVVNVGNYAGSAPMYHGHSSKSEEQKKEVEKFFRYVDKLITDQFTKGLGTQLIPVTLPEHQGQFRSISQNPNLLEKGISRSFESMSKKEMQDQLWQIIEPYYLEKTANLVKRFRNADAVGMGTKDLANIGRALVECRVDTLIIEADRIIPGYFNMVNGMIEHRGLDHPQVDDVLDDMAEFAITRGCQVVVLPKDRMPSATGCAAIFRF